MESYHVHSCHDQTQERPGVHNVHRNLSCSARYMVSQGHTPCTTPDSLSMLGQHQTATASLGIQVGLGVVSVGSSIPRNNTEVWSWQPLSNHQTPQLCQALNAATDKTSIPCARNCLHHMTRQIWLSSNTTNQCKAL